MSERDLVSYIIADAIQSATYSEDEFSELDKAWLFSKSKDAFSFDWCCEVLGLNSKLFREKLFSYMSAERFGRDRGAGIILN